MGSCVQAIKSAVLIKKICNEKTPKTTQIKNVIVTMNKKKVKVEVQLEGIQSPGHLRGKNRVSDNVIKKEFFWPGDEFLVVLQFKGIHT